MFSNASGTTTTNWSSAVVDPVSPWAGVANPIDLLFIQGRCTPRRSYVTTHEGLRAVHAGGASQSMPRVRHEEEEEEEEAT